MIQRELVSRGIEVRRGVDELLHRIREKVMKNIRSLHMRMIRLFRSR